MDEFAQFVHITGTDDPFGLPNFDLRNPEKKCFPFDIVDLNPGRTAVVMFLVRAGGPVRLLMRFNNKTPRDIDFTFDPSDSESMRSFHEVLPGDHLTDGRNEVCIEARSSDDGEGWLEISDLVVFYHAKA